MTKSEVELSQIGKAVGDILGIVRCLLLLKDVEEYQRWLRKYHSIEMTPSYFSGYKLAFNTLLRTLASEIERNTSLGLDEDDIFSRARFHGVNINKLPNTCEKTVLIKNLFNYAKKVIDSNDWHNFQISMAKFSEAILYPLEKIRDISVVNPQSNIKDIETAVNYASIFQVYIFLNDTSRGRPHGYTTAMLDDGIKIFNYNRQIAISSSNAFSGYKLGVQYLWSHLLMDRFNASVVSNLHQANDWASFDHYFEHIRKEIIHPIEQHTGARFGFDHLVLINDSPKRLLKELLGKKPPQAELSRQDNLRIAFLWYPIVLIDSSDFSFIGIPALLPLLMGMIQTKRRGKDKAKAKLIRLTHGEAYEHRRHYSYAILLELGGFISDASGWMLSYDCCSDGGSTSGLYRDIENLLHRYEQNGFIEVTNIRIDKHEFVDLMKEDIVSMSPSENDNA